MRIGDVLRTRTFCCLVVKVCFGCSLVNGIKIIDVPFDASPVSTLVVRVDNQLMNRAVDTIGTATIARVAKSKIGGVA